jgi:hypothetical protein
MEEELINIQVEETEPIAVNIDEPIQETVVKETVAAIEVGKPETTVVKMTEVTNPYNIVLLNQDNQHSHKLDQVEQLIEILTKLASTKQEYAIDGGFAEFRQWKDFASKGIGYFVQLVNENGNLVIDVCTDSDVGVYGVTVDHSGFCGHQAAAYDRLGLTDENGDKWNKDDDNSYEQVCLIGCVEVRTNDASLSVGDYVVPGVLGYAVKSENEVGYRVVSTGTKIFDSTPQNYVQIMLTPQNENVNRIAEAITEAQGGVGNLNASLGDLIDRVDGIDKVIISIGGDIGGLRDEINENLKVPQDKLDAANMAIEQAKDIATQATQTMEKITGEYAQTLTDLSIAKESSAKALEDLEKIQEELEPLASWASVYECELQINISQNKECYFEIDGIKYKFTMPINITAGNVVQYDATTQTIIVGDKRVKVAATNDITDATLIEPFNPSGDFGIAGFVAQANKDATTLASMTEAFGPDGSDITAIIQKIDSNGGAIEMIVSHTDKYSLGEKSPTNGFTLVEAEVLNPGHIYVPTITHSESSPKYLTIWNSKINKDDLCYFKVEDKTYCFIALQTFEVNTLIEFNINNNKLLVGDIVHTYSEATEIPENTSIATLKTEKTFNFQYLDVDNKKSCMSYEWGYDQDAMTNAWIQSKEVSTTTEYEDGNVDGDLWYLSKPILSGDIILYSPDILYCWNAAKKIWMPVAKANDPKASTMGAILQTASKLTSTYTDVKGNMSVIQQEVDRIATMVENGDALSKIEQTAEDIIAGVYNPEEGTATQLELLLGGMNNSSVQAVPKMMQSISGNGPDALGGNKYDNPPVWNGTKFEVVGEPSIDGKYYIAEEDAQQYYELIDGGYRVWAIDTVALTYLTTRVDENEAEIASLAKFKTNMSETIASITQIADAERAEIYSTVLGEFQKRIDIELEPTNEMVKSLVGATKYLAVPTINNDKFVFDISKQSDKGEYCQLNNDTTTYYKILYNGEEIIGYETYEIISSGSASILQKVDQNSSSIGVVVENDTVKAGVIVDAINDTSNVSINADKIGVNGTAVFRDNMRDGTTTISGNYIKTGVLMSENYDGPVTYVEQLKIVEDDGQYKLDNLNDSDGFNNCIRYAPIISGVEYELSPIVDSEEQPISYYFSTFIEVKDKTGVDNILSEFTFQKGIYDGETGYIISNTDFDLIPQNGTENYATTGTKFDLNVGTIYSKNLILDRNGNLDITGRITATSGYIGDADNGFKIEARSNQLIYIVPDEGLKKGTYYFTFSDNQFYSFQLPNNLLKGDRITIHSNMSYYKINKDLGSSLSVGTSPPDNGTKLTFKNGTYYCLHQNQRSDNQGAPGVFISPECIDLGNGNFYVDDLGNVTMKGNIVLGGSITWDSSNSPVKALYSFENIYPPGTADYNKIYWHFPARTNDRYACYSYDGGVTWTVPITIQGEPGSNDVDDEYIFNLLTKNGSIDGLFPFHTDKNRSKLYINAQYIASNTLSADQIYGGTLQGVTVLSKNSNDDIIQLDDSHICFIDGESEATKLNMGFHKFTNGDTFPYLVFGAGTEGTSKDNKLPVPTNAGYLYKAAFLGINMFSIGLKVDTSGSWVNELDITFRSNDYERCIDFGNSSVTFGTKKALLDTIKEDIYIDFGESHVDFSQCETVAFGAHIPTAYAVFG